MSTGYQIKDQTAMHYLTFQVVEWIDVFTRLAYRDIAINSLRFCQQNKGLQVFGYVIMSNHIHIIASSPEGKLSDIIRDLKKFTSHSIIKQVIEGNESRKDWILNRFQYNAQRHSRNEKYQMWTHENHPINVYSPEFAREKLDYIHNNPVRAGIVRKPEEYVYSSASNYAEMESILDVIIMDLKWKIYF
jgi:REP element-mobilizing transposase RayT